jgi:diguanylate cyclase (GGDEF)-like protein/PAS domain S-box-containing protein
MDVPAQAPPRILIVEDERELGDAMERTLTDLGYEVVGQARTGQEGVEAASRHHPDVVLMDVRLPGPMDGRHAARIIGELFDIPIVYATGIAARDELRTIMRSAPHGYVLKPFGHSELLAAVELALQRWGSERVHRDREEWFEHILENQGEMVAVLDASGTVDYVSPPVTTVLGCPPEAFIGRALLEEAHPDDREKLREAMARAFAEPGGRLELEGRFRTEAGGWQLLHLAGRRYGSRGRADGDDRRPVRIVASARAVTGREAAQPGPRAGTDRPRPLLPDAGAGAFRASEYGEIRDANHALVQMLGYGSRRELLGTSMAGLIPDRRTRARLLSLLRRERTVANVEVRLRSKRGTEVVGLLAAHLTRPGDGSEPFVIGTVMDITERKQLEDNLERMAFEDPLTGLVNRRALADMAARYLALARRRATRLGLVYLDLASFKSINDTFGHAAGDEVLTEVAHRLKSGARESDVLCRIGGDEFVVLLPEVSGLDAVVEVARRMESELDRPVPASSSSARVRAEMGVAVFPDHGSDFTSLLRAADGAMYAAKRRRGQGSGIAVAGNGDRRF